MSSARSNDASTSKGGFLSGNGDGRLQKSLLVKNELPLTASTSSLVEKLKRFLPDIEKANADLVYGQKDSVPAIEVIPAGDSDEEEEEETLEPRIEMNISLFPIEDKGDDDDDNEASLPNTVETDAQPRQKRSRPVEEVEDNKEGA